MKYILITGVSTGIGYETTKIFIKNGYHVLGSLRKTPDAERLQQEFMDRFTPLLFDITDHNAIKQAVKIVKEKTGDSGLSGLINNAGISVTGPIEFIDVESFRYQFEVNFFGHIAVIKNFLPLLGAKKKCPYPPGRIVNISSISGVIPFPFMSPYCSSKFALEAFSHSLRTELLPYGIDVIIIGPGSIKTPIWDKIPQLSQEILDSVYGTAITRFAKNAMRSAENGISLKFFANKLFRIFESDNPRYRYSIVKNKFFYYTLTKMLINTKLMKNYFTKMYK